MPATSALENLGQYITEARVLLQDKHVPYRYPDADIVNALNFGLLEARRLRADLFLTQNFKPAWFSPDGTIDTDAPVPMDEQYRTSFVYYVVGRCQLRDDEATTDARSSAFMQKFLQQMLVITS